MSTIAGVVLTLNEEHDLPRALSSLSWCDELLVVDSGSSDGTHDVAKASGARVLQRIQSPPFLITDQRNWALESAGLTSDWVLFIDADEEISITLQNHILSTINSASCFDAYELTPRYWFLGKWLKLTQGYPNWHPRLLKRGYSYFQGGVWESFASGTVVGRIKYPYEHYAFSKGLDDWIFRHLRYASWDAAQTIEYLETRSSFSLSTKRWRSIRIILSRFWFLRPPLRFLQKYFFQFGFLEGWQSLVFATMMFVFDFMTVIKVIEGLRKKKGLPL